MRKHGYQASTTIPPACAEMSGRLVQVTSRPLRRVPSTNLLFIAAPSETIVREGEVKVLLHFPTIGLETAYL